VRGGFACRLKQRMEERKRELQPGERKKNKKASLLGCVKKKTTGKRQNQKWGRSGGKKRLKGEDFKGGRRCPVTSYA